jgi:hypothetical protein
LVRAWVSYALAAAAAGLGLAVVLALLVWPAARSAVWSVAAMAYVVQLVAFAVLLAARANPNRFLLAWAGGTVLRLSLLAGLAVWLWVTGVEPRTPWLLGLAGMLFLLMLLEPVFLRRESKAT